MVSEDAAGEPPIVICPNCGSQDVLKLHRNYVCRACKRVFPIESPEALQGNA